MDKPRTPSACQFESDARTLLRSGDLAGYSHAHHELTCGPKARNALAHALATVQAQEPCGLGVCG